MDLALLLYNPATRMAPSILPIFAFARIFGLISKLFERFSKALSVLRSAVFWDITVTTSVSNGSRFTFVHSGQG